MPFASNRGQRIHYTVEGAGPLVVLQHGLLWDAGSWAQGGMVAALADGFQVACIDSLGHGLSDKPSDPALYDQPQRSGDVVAVIEHLGHERAHLVGYSMGGWIAVGMAKHHPGRLLSLIVGGWDLVKGLPPGPKGPLSFELFMGYVRRVAPAAVEWITPEFKPGVRACFEALHHLHGAGEAVVAACVPTLLWGGRDDPYHDAMQAFATAHEFPFLSTAGDHAAAVLRPGAQVIASIRAFLEGRGLGAAASGQISSLESA